MLNNSTAWQALLSHKTDMQDTHLRDLFADDRDRADRFSLEAGPVFMDYSRHVVTPDTMQLLCDLARETGLESVRDDMFSGAAINTSEDRAVLHTALRAPAGAEINVDGENVVPFVHDVLARMKAFSDGVRSGTWTGHTGQAIKTVVNIGIGGSDLGPYMVCEALRPFRDGGPNVHFVSNVDAADIEETLAHCDPETTLFIVASKTFTTQETMRNAHTAKDWLLSGLKDEAAIPKHFVALSTNMEGAGEFGIAEDNIFPFRDWVGGRYSLWSAIGLSICLAVGFENFRALLDGAAAMDEHFKTAPLDKNMPVVMALLGVWYRNFWGAQSYAVLPYAQSLHLLPGWLQQLDMESNGKQVTKDGEAVSYDTGPVVFGAAGTNGQHAFYQLIHQGTTMIPCDFIGAVKSEYNAGHHRILLANMLAQAKALAFGRSQAESQGNLQKTFPGNIPSTTLLLERLDPYNLGMLLSLYEHKIFVQGVIWGINSFDQWGVELGKVLAKDILSDLSAGKPAAHHDAATTALIRKIIASDA